MIRPVTKINFLPDALTRFSASIVDGATFPSLAIVPS